MSDQVPDLPGFTPERIEERIRSYESFGNHRTGSTADDRTATWLVEELHNAGVNAVAERFNTPVVEYRRARLTTPDGEIEGTPMFDGGFTGFGGVQGELCEDTDEDVFGKIVVATSATRGDQRWTAAFALDHYRSLEEQGIVGVIVPSGDPEGQVVLRNAEHIRTPFSLPVLQIAQRDIGKLSTALVLGNVEATLEVDGERLQSRAKNVVAEVPGTDPEAAPVIVMTPRSGWFTCAAERGGGIAVWLALAEHLAANPPPRTVHFVASSGHELHHTGLGAYLHQHSSLVPSSAATLHLGASIGARYPQARMGASDQALHDLASQALTAEGIEDLQVYEVGSPGGGEARDIAARDGRYVTFLGGHRYFHSPQDTYDNAGDADNVARWSRAARRVLDGILAGA